MMMILVMLVMGDLSMVLRENGESIHSTTIRLLVRVRYGKVLTVPQEAPAKPSRGFWKEGRYLSAPMCRYSMQEGGETSRLVLVGVASFCVKHTHHGDILRTNKQRYE